MRHFPLVLFTAAALAAGDLESARDVQDRAALEKLAAKQTDPYQAALAYSYLSAVAMEQRDKGGAKRAAEAGIPFAEKAVAAKAASEHYRILGTLYGQVIPAAPLTAFTFGRKSQDAINKAIELDPKSAMAYVSRGVGEYYLPQPLGGGVELAMKSFEKAIALNPKLDEAQLWMGLALRKAGRNADARKAFQKALDLNPRRAWTKQQLEKTPQS